MIGHPSIKWLQLYESIVERCLYKNMHSPENALNYYVLVWARFNFMVPQKKTKKKKKQCKHVINFFYMYIAWLDKLKFYRVFHVLQWYLFFIHFVLCFLSQEIPLITCFTHRYLTLYTALIPWSVWVED